MRNLSLAILLLTLPVSASAGDFIIGINLSVTGNDRYHVQDMNLGKPTSVQYGQIVKGIGRAAVLKFTSTWEVHIAEWLIPAGPSNSSDKVFEYAFQNPRSELYCSVIFERSKYESFMEKTTHVIQCENLGWRSYPGF